MTNDSHHLVDAHCHLQDKRLEPHLDGVMRRAREAGICVLHVCGTSEADWDAVASLSRRLPGVFFSLGLHPWYTASRSPDWQRHLEQRLASSTCGIGEIGLDHALEPRDEQDQEAVFRAQWALSYALKRPASIHCRRAWEALARILTDFGPHPSGFVIHSYSGSDELVPLLTACHAYFSFSGSITRSGNKRGRKAAAAVPADRLLIESDAPDIMPILPAGQQPWSIDEQGKALSEPAYLPLMLQTLAELRGEDPTILAQQIHDNARNLFKDSCP